MAESKATATTAICGYDADNILVRGKDLIADLIGKYSFTEMIILQALGREPTALQVRIVDTVLVTIMEHGLVPSAIATRLTYYGAPDSYQGAIAAGLLGVGDRYAGTASECGEILEKMVAAAEAERAAVAREQVQAYRKIRRPLPGFGHPIHQANDPRVARLLQVVEEAGADGRYVAAMNQLEAVIREEVGKPLVTNISAAIGAALGEAGIPSKLMRGIILTARCAGLVGHLFEEMNNPAAHEMWIAAEENVRYEP